MPMSTMAAMSSPSKIPLPKSRMAPLSSGSAAASAEDLSSSATASPAHLVSRIPKAVSPERTVTQHHSATAKSETAADDKENGLVSRNNNGWESSSKPRAANLNGSATFVRRPSPPRSTLPSERSDAAVNAMQCEIEIDERVLERKLQESRESNWRKLI